jgi:hypothetical protein
VATALVPPVGFVVVLPLDPPMALLVCVEAPPLALVVVVPTRPPFALAVLPPMPTAPPVTWVPPCAAAVSVVPLAWLPPIAAPPTVFMALLLVAAVEFPPLGEANVV